MPDWWTLLSAVVAEEHRDLLKRPPLRLREEEVRAHPVGEVTHDKDEEVLPPDVFERDWGRLRDTHVARPVRHRRDTRAPCSQVGGEDLRLVDPGHGPKAPGEEPGKRERRRDTRDADRFVGVRLAAALVHVERRVRARLPRHDEREQDGADDERPTPPDPVHEEGDEDPDAEHVPRPGDAVDQKGRGAVEAWC